MKRIVVVGSGGAGKSSLARALGGMLGLDVIHLDRYFWDPGWVATPRDEWREVVAHLVAREAWVMDGNYTGTMDIRFPAADTIIFMDFPRWRCLWQAVTRLIRYRGQSRPDLAPGCLEQLDWPFLRWIWNYPNTVRPIVMAKLAEYADGRVLVLLKSPRDVELLLAGVQSARGVPGFLRFETRAGSAS